MTPAKSTTKNLLILILLDQNAHVPNADICLSEIDNLNFKTSRDTAGRASGRWEYRGKTL
jgi:hypothetical protein